MAYKIKIKHTPYQNKETVRYIEKLRWKKKENAKRYNSAWGGKDTKVVEA